MWPKTDGRFVYWSGNIAAAFYDTEIDKIVLLGFSGMGNCDIKMGDNHIVLTVVPFSEKYTPYFYIMNKPF